MEILSKQTRVNTIRKRWEFQYPPDREPDRWTRVNKELIDNPPKTCEEIDDLIGNSSWTRIRCYQCDEEKDVVVRVGEEPDYESSTSWICEDCLKIALKMIRTHKKRKLIEINQVHVIECDNPECDYSVDNPTGDPNVDLTEYLNQECPQCGENLLTEEDLYDYKKVLRLINRMNWWLSWVTIFIPKNKKPSEGSVKVHDGIKMKEES